MSRCFGDDSLLYAAYHDKEWGIPVYDDHKLFEMLILEGAQAGLSWLTILQRREGYRRLFHHFDPEKVAHFSDLQLEEILLSKEIIRNRLKIFSTRTNARVFLALQKEYGSFATYLWNFVDHKPQKTPRESLLLVPTRDPLSDQISKDLKKRGMSFVGSTIIYAFLQAVGVVSDHLTTCPYVDPKYGLRKTLLELRQNLSPSRQQEASHILCHQLEKLSYPYILSFIPMGSEIEISQLNTKWAQGNQLVLPKVEGDALTLYIVTDIPSQTLLSPFKIYEPNPALCPKIDEKKIPCVLVPGIGFDAAHHRLGFGKGHYDRLLKKMDAVKIGLGFQEQLVPTIYPEPHDVPLDQLLLG